jgi:LysR family hydrogen peroxide-inducible transcriptional activator
MTLLPYLAKNQLEERCIQAHLRYFNDPVPRRKVRIVYGREYLKKNIISAFKDEVLDAIPKELKNEDGMLVE